MEGLPVLVLLEVYVSSSLDTAVGTVLTDN
jgi:hypothetical protein